MPEPISPESISPESINPESPSREAIIDLAAVASNLRAIREFVSMGVTTPPLVMAVVKANGYGHGAVAVAQAAQDAGADWLGVATVTEALELRAAGITAPLLAWLHGVETDFAAAIDANVALGVSSPLQLRAVAAAAAERGRVASVHIKIDTGLSRNGVAGDELGSVFANAREAEQRAELRVEGLFSHLSNTSPDDDAAQCAVFDLAVGAAAAAGLTPSLLHIAATAAALSEPRARYSMVRTGIGLYGLSPWGNGFPEGLSLTPVMTLLGRIAAVRRVPLNTAVSYDYLWRSERETTLALVPLGYADGVPRQASGQAMVSIGGTQHPIVGRIAMDQFVVDVGDTTVSVGDPVVLFGNSASGVPSAEDWAEAAGTINYEIVTRIGHRVVRRAQ